MRRLTLSAAVMHVASCNVASFPDTLAFLSLLSHLDDPPAAEGALELPERRAARGLFSWEVSQLTTPAPWLDGSLNGWLWMGGRGHGGRSGCSG